MKIVGYCDPLHAAPGDTVRFMVSSAHPSYRADLVRVVHCDNNPRGPGFKAPMVESAISGDYAGREQEIRTGSSVQIPCADALGQLESFTVAAWIMPTMPVKAEAQALIEQARAAGPEGQTLQVEAPGSIQQAVITHGLEAPDNAGYGLFVGIGGHLVGQVGDGAGGMTVAGPATPLVEHQWTLAAMTYDADSRRLAVYQLPKHPWPVERGRGVAVTTAPGSRPPAGAPLVMAAAVESHDDGAVLTHSHFNGKIDAPRVYDRALSSDEIEALARGGDSLAVAGLVAAWDFSRDISTDRVTDVGPHGLHGRAVQMPTRAVTGHNYTGRETSYRLAQGEYGAIHFHDDDLEDALWEVDFELTVPDDLRSGVYAAWVRSGDDEDYITFFVRPADDAETAPIGVLMSTVSYVTYANFRDVDGGFWSPERVPNADPSLNPAAHEFLRANPMPGLYDFHSDGTGAALCSWRRPILNMRPTYRYRVWSAPSRFPADPYVIDWLEARGLEYDVITDHDVHAQGADLLKRHRVIISASHPEYWTSPMIEGLEAYLNDGGRLMYLGGNGFFGVAAVDPNRPHVVEVRRWGTSWPFEHPPAERVLATTGELGGAWRNRGRPPQALVGIGCGSAGFDKGSPYIRQPDSHDPRAAFIFEGIGDDERIGDVPSLVVNHGAAGYEMDRLDFSLGTPPHTLLLATSLGHSDKYVGLADEALWYTRGIDGVSVGDPTTPGEYHPFIRADMTYFETPNGGGVFSVGSIAWRSCLSYNDYDNTVSRVTENVVRRFASPEPLADPSANPGVFAMAGESRRKE